MLANVRIVLIDTTHPGNIGGVARAMKNMCLQQLCLVQPHEFPSEVATARASGAQDILARARVYDSLDEALADCTLVIGTTARRRALDWPQLTPRECAEQSVREAVHTPVALLFGRERSGLTNAQLERCHRMVTIPSNPDYSSLNLGAAVQVLAYELLMAARSEPAAMSVAAARPAAADDMRRFYAHLEEVLVALGFMDPANPRKLMQKLVRLFNRAVPTAEETNILRGILTAVQRRDRDST